jgi:hypothetical protein
MSARNLCALAAFGAASLLTSVAMAQEGTAAADGSTKPADPCAPAPLPPPRPFDGGSLLVRLTAGPGYMWGSGDADTGISSAAGGFGVTMGAFLTKGLALHGDFNFQNGYDPDFYLTDGSVDHETNLVFQTSTFHAGLSYYSEPMRLYGSLGVGVGVALLSTLYYLDEGVTVAGTEYTNAGPAFQLQVGKEWPISRYWALGVAVDYQYLHVNVGEDDARIVVDDLQQLGLRFVGTFAGQ